MSVLVLAEASGAAGYVVAAIALTCVALMLFFAEIFIPSFGLISLVALGCMAGSVALAFQAGAGVGYLFMVLNALAIPVVVVVAFKLLPRSPLVLSQTFEDKKPKTPAVHSDEALVGREGVAETDLRPAGKAEIDGRRVDVLTGGEYIESGTRVKVVRVEGARVFVRMVKQ